MERWEGHITISTNCGRRKGERGTSLTMALEIGLLLKLKMLFNASLLSKYKIRSCSF